MPGTRRLPQRLSRRSRTRPGPPPRGQRATPRSHALHPLRPPHPLLRESQNDPRTPGPRPGLLGKSRRSPDALGRPAARPRKPFRPKITRPDHAAHPSPNLLAKAEAPTAPGTHLVSDITYIPTCEGWLYLAIVLDLYSRSILGWKLAESLHTEVVTGALCRALDTRLVAPDALFHSDRGCQYTAASTRTLLARHHLRQSMSAAGYCYDNAFAESAFASLKSELLDDGAPFASKAAATTAVFDYLETFYNRKRRHSSLAYQSPQAFLDSYFQNLKPSLN